jgi:hypothetical protein
VSPAGRDEGGIRRIRRGVAVPPGGLAAEESWPGANEAKVEKLRRGSLQRRAGARGFELRHSAYGYALIDSARTRVEGRSDLSLDEVESWLDRD